MKVWWIINYCEFIEWACFEKTDREVSGFIVLMVGEIKLFGLLAAKPKPASY